MGDHLVLAVAGLPPGAEVRRQAARIADLAPADFDRRLVGILPRVLLSGLSGDRAEQLSTGLAALGYTLLTCDPAAVPGDGDRLVARELQLADRALVITDGQGNTHTCPRAAISLFQRGVRLSRTTTKATTSERRFSIGKALLSGGLLLTSKVERTQVKTRDSQEAFLLVQRSDGEPDIIVYERRLDYRFLGPEMSTSSRTNLDRVLAALCGLAPDVAVDERVAQPGFVSGLPTTPADPVDLALFLVTLARLKHPDQQP